MLRHSAFLCLLTFLCNVAFANPGIYENLLIGVDPQTGIVTGAFHEERNSSFGPSFSCIFAITGNKNDVAINAGFPGDKKITQGEMRFQEEQGIKKVFIKLANQQPGCLQTTPFNFLQGGFLDLTAHKPWIAVMTVMSKKAHFYDSPNINKKRRAYLVYSDCVGVLKIEKDWAKVEYVSENRTIVGWVRLQELGHI